MGGVGEEGWREGGVLGDSGVMGMEEDHRRRTREGVGLGDGAFIVQCL